MSPKPSPQRSDANNLLWVVAVILSMAGACAVYTSYVVQSVLDALMSSNTMALLITDNGFRSDDLKLEAKLNSAQQALQTSADVATALTVACIMVATGLIARVVFLNKHEHQAPKKDQKAKKRGSLPVVALFAACLVSQVGCKSAPEPVPPPVVIKTNPEKDAYITRVEKEVSEAAAAVTVSIKSKTIELLPLTETRLNGIAKPTPDQVRKYESALTSKAELKKEEAKAAKVDAETTALYDRVNKMDKENAELKATIEAERRAKAFDELRNKCITLAGLFAIGGAGLLVLSTFVGKGKAAGVTLLLLAGITAAAPYLIEDLINATWFKWTAGSVVVLGILWGVKEAIEGHTEVRSRLTQEPPASG